MDVLHMAQWYKNTLLALQHLIITDPWCYIDSISFVELFDTGGKWSQINSAINSQSLCQ